MGMKVTCAWCKIKVEKKDAVFKSSGKNNTYYCCQEHMEAAIKKKEFAKKEKEIKDKIYSILTEIFGYEVQNTVLYKEWSCWNKIANNEKIFNYLCENKDYIKGKIERLSSSEFAKIRYVSAVLKNSLKDYNNRGKRAQMPVIDDAMPKENVVDTDYIMPTNKKKKTERRKGFGE